MKMKWQNIVVGAGMAAWGWTAFAAYPERPVTMVVPFAAGGSSDNIARSMSQQLTEQLGKSVVIENVGGAGGTIGTTKVVRATPDGYTMLLGSGSEILINKLINPKTPYDAIKDLSPLVFIGTGSMVLVGKTALPAGSVKELLALAKRKPDSLSYASAGNGTPMHVAGELFKMRSGTSIIHVPYRGAAPALIDIVGGQIDLGVATVSAALPHIRTGKVKAYAVTTLRRTELAPEIPALSETPGLEGFDLGVWFGLFVPAATPKDVGQKLQTVSTAVLQDPAVRKRLTEQGITPSGASADVLAKFMNAEIDKYRKVIESAKITAE
jgi:tripartite-type tricarboxylate transporter receptor subunit TctC